MKRCKFCKRTSETHTFDDDFEHLYEGDICRRCEQEMGTGNILILQELNRMNFKLRDCFHKLSSIESKVSQ